MNKESLMFGVLGLIVGLVIGFVGANSMNRTAAGVSPALAPSAPGAAVSGNPALPPDHPPLGTSSGEKPQGAPLPQITEAIEKAKQRPQDYEAQMTAADLYYQIERFAEAAKYYETAIKLKPAEAEPLIKAGNSYFDAKNFETAEKWYSLALAKEPKNINVRNDYGLTFYLRSPRDLTRAIKEYKLSLEIEPNHEFTLQNLAIAYSESGDMENLRATIEKLKKINPQNSEVLKNAGV